MSDYRVSRHARTVADDNGGLVVLHTRTGQWYLLNRSGAEFWRALTDGRPLEATATALARRYPAVARDQIRADLKHLVAELTRADLVTVRSEPTDPPGAAPATPPDRPLPRISPADRLAAAVGVLLALGLAHLPFWLCMHAVRVARHTGSRPARPAEAMATVLATRRVARLSPGRAACLELSLAAVMAATLRGRRLDWCLGLSSDPLRFHAWVEAEGRMIVHPDDEPADRSYHLALRL